MCSRVDGALENHVIIFIAALMNIAPNCRANRSKKEHFQLTQGAFWIPFELAMEDLENFRFYWLTDRNRVEKDRTFQRSPGCPGTRSYNGRYPNICIQNNNQAGTFLARPTRFLDLFSRRYS